MRATTFARRTILDDVLEPVLARMVHDGTLDVVVNWLRDQRDGRDRDLRNALKTHVLSSAEQLAEFNAAQGAVLVLDELANKLEAWGCERATDQTRAARGEAPPAPLPRRVRV